MDQEKLLFHVYPLQRLNCKRLGDAALRQIAAHSVPFSAVGVVLGSALLGNCNFQLPANRLAQLLSGTSRPSSPELIVSNFKGGFDVNLTSDFECRAAALMNMLKHDAFGRKKA